MPYLLFVRCIRFRRKMRMLPLEDAQLVAERYVSYPWKDTYLTAETYASFGDKIGFFRKNRFLASERLVFVAVKTGFYIGVKAGFYDGKNWFLRRQNPVFTTEGADWRFFALFIRRTFTDFKGLEGGSEEKRKTLRRFLKFA